MSIPLITVLITTYNYGQFLEEAIDSVLAQEFPQEKVEIVVIDDGSTDGTGERVKKYGSRVGYFYQANGGQAAALNAGFANAHGEIVALLDADDLFLPGRLARIEEAFKQKPELGMVYHGMLEWNMETNERRESTFPLVSGDVKTVPDLFLFYEAQATSCIAFRRAALSQLLPIPEHIRMLADGYLVDLIPFLCPILAIPEPFVVYRIHGKNCFYTDSRRVPTEVRKKTLKTRRILVDAMRKWLADSGYTKKQVPVRVFLAQWDLYLESEGFLIQPPGRLRYFWWRVRRNQVDSIRQTWRFTFFNYLTAAFALVFGYTKADEMYEWRTRTLETTKRMYRKFVGPA
jgi:glycosyltransferase involved in cell wall biosynthesis